MAAKASRWAALVFALLSACGPRGASPRPLAAAPAVDAPAADAPVPAAAPRGLDRRAFAPTRAGVPVLAGISYGPFREGQAPGGPDPSRAQIAEDLRIIAERWGMIRVYSSRPPTDEILSVIAEEGLPLQVMVGAWIAPESEPGAAEANAAEVAALIRLANAHPEQVVAVSVGNETQVAWSGHRSDPATLIRHIRAVRQAVPQPVTTADDYNFWNKPESHAVAAEVDFLLLHAYAMWNQQPLEQAVPWTAGVVAGIQAEHPALRVVLGETGWATALNPEGDERQYIKAPAGEAEQARFYAAFTAWAAEAGQAHFYFEAFDEPWKGSGDPREVEKHWGLYDAARQPKQAIRGGAP